MTVRGICLFAILFLSQSSSLHAVTWEAQAERLQQVSAAQLDAAPIPAPYSVPLTFRFQVNSALLPKVDPTVGGKSEKVPAAPFHAIPMVQIEDGGDLTPSKWISGGLWVGHLPPGGEKLVGITAKLQQTIYGAGFMISHKGQVFRPYLQFFAQQGTADMQGGITSEHAKDKFDVETKLWGVSLGNQMMLGGQNIWFAASFASRSADSKFYIEEDQTTFKLNDYQKLSLGDGLRQVAGGIDFSWGLRIGGGISNVPNRITMPKAVVAYSLSF